jgi:hypothetical protein
MAHPTGNEFEAWLFSPEHSKLPDFLDFPEFPLGDRLIKSDICSLRALARGSPHQLPPNFREALRRLHAHGIIARLESADSYLYMLLPYGYEVLLHNVSYREEIPPNGQQLV